MSECLLYYVKDGLTRWGVRRRAVGLGCRLPVLAGATLPAPGPCGPPRTGCIGACPVSPVCLECFP